MERCSNCDATIGSLQVPAVWNDNIVCQACHKVLSCEDQLVTPPSELASTHLAASEISKSSVIRVPVTVPEGIPAQPINQCPKCGNEDVVKLEVYHASGTVVTFGKRLAISQSAAVLRIAPPTRKSYGEVIGLGLLGLVIAYFLLAAGHWMVGTLVTATVIVIAAISAGNILKWNENTFPLLYHDWQSSWICRRCGTTFRLRETFGVTSQGLLGYARGE